MPEGYRLIDHPADVGIEASGGTLGEAFARAAEGMMSVIVDPSSVGRVETRAVTLPPADPERLLVRWLAEVLYLYDGERFVAAAVGDCEVSASGLRAELSGEPLDRSRHVLRTDVKAVTYHGVAVAAGPHGHAVRVYLDI